MISFLKKLFKKNSTEKGEIPKKFIAKFLPKNPIIVEAGAHVGADTLEMARLWPNSKIYAFEPVPYIFEQLIKNTERLKNATYYPIALSNKSGKSVIYVSSGASDASSSLLSPKEHLNFHPDVSFNKKLDINTITLDDWAIENDIMKVDLLWLDLQGLELKVLKAGTNVLKSVKVIYSEVSLIENYDGGELYSELKDWLESNSFQVVKEELPWEDGGNVLFVKR